MKTPAKGSESSVVYKVLRATEWADFATTGTFAGSPDDLRDGFVHLSTREQLPGTLAKHFAGLEGLVIVAFDPLALQAGLRWEASRGGALFPHFYGVLRFEDAELYQPG